MTQPDTIAAIATAAGAAGIGIVRVSGASAVRIAEAVAGKCPSPRFAQYASFKGASGNIIDQGIVLYFAAPHSFTGEDIVEFQGHGGKVVLDRLLHRIQQLGARAARAGEFSERAFLNNKIDLLQAEAIADLIAAESEQSAAAAMQSLQGEFSKAVNNLLQQLIQLRVHVESTLDFPEEEIDFLADAAIAQQLQQVMDQVETIHHNSRCGRLLTEGLRVVITGKPNAGKSSLLNLLAGHDSAIVSDIPGTTRDVLREHIRIEGVPLHVIDTAGLREADNVIEREGVRRAQQEIEQADIVLHVFDATLVHKPEAVRCSNEIQVLNKADLLEQKPNCEQHQVLLSARTGDGLIKLKQKILQLAGYQPAEQNTGVYSARRRHLEALEVTAQHLEQAWQALTVDQAGEVMAEELRMAQQTLSSITGEFSSDDLLGRIFSEFCIGK